MGIIFLKIFITFLAFCTMFAFPAQATQKYTACAKEKKFQTPIKIDLVIPDPHFDLTRSRKEINEGQEASHQAWLEKNQMETVWQASKMETLGQAAGGWAMLAEIRTTGVPYDRYGTSYCPYFKSVRLNMMYRTIISIPKNFGQGGCMFNHILEHEMKHHITNVEVVTETVARLEKDLPIILSEIESSGSYVSRPQTAARFEMMQEGLKEAVQIYMSQTMRNEMAKRNALIDTPEEYARGGVAMKECGGK
jgi:hypothetical protein